MTIRHNRDAQPNASTPQGARVPNREVVTRKLSPEEMEAEFSKKQSPRAKTVDTSRTSTHSQYQEQRSHGGVIPSSDPLNPYNRLFDQLDSDVPSREDLSMGLAIPKSWNGARSKK